MIWTTLIVNILVIFVPADTLNIAGTYSLSRKGQINSYSWSITTLELNCDSTTSISRKTHGGLIGWTGFWTTHNDTLSVNLKPTEDGIKYFGLSGEVNQFLIRKNKLVPIITEIKGEKIKDRNLLERLNKILKQDKYKRTQQKDCS